MVSLLPRAAMACSSMFLCLSAKNGHIFGKKSDTKESIIGKRNHTTGKIAISCLGLIPGCGPSALISLNGDMALRFVGDKKRFTMPFLIPLIGSISAIYGIANRSALSLGISLGTKTATITMNYFNDPNQFKITSDDYVPLALDAFLIGSAALGSGPLFTGAVTITLLWIATSSLVELQTLPKAP